MALQELAQALATRSNPEGVSKVVNPRDEQLRFFYTSELAAFLRRPDSTLRYWRKLGQGPKWGKLGRRVIYFESDVMEWIEAEAGHENTAQERLA